MAAAAVESAVTSTSNGKVCGCDRGAPQLQLLPAAQRHA
jgi:hypothetical protein